MKVFDELGRVLTKIFLDAAGRRKGQDVIYVIDQEVKEIQEAILNELKTMNRHLSEITDLEIKED